MTDRRPKDMTEEELEALPVGPIDYVFEPYTLADIKAGAVGRGRTRPIYREVRATYYEPDDPIGWFDNKGRAYTFGQYADGSWYKRPAPF